MTPKKKSPRLGEEKSGKGNILEARLSGAGQETDSLLKFTLPHFALDHLCVKMTLEVLGVFFMHIEEMFKK